MSNKLVLFIHSLFPEDRGQAEIGDGIELIGVYETKDQVKTAILEHYEDCEETQLNWDYFDEYSLVEVEDAVDFDSENKLGYIVKTTE